MCSTASSHQLCEFRILFQLFKMRSPILNYDSTFIWTKMPYLEVFLFIIKSEKYFLIFCVGGDSVFNFSDITPTYTINISQVFFQCRTTCFEDLHIFFTDFKLFGAAICRTLYKLNKFNRNKIKS